MVTVGLPVLAAELLFSPRELVGAARQGLWTMFSVSNLFFWGVTDYWSPAAKGFLLLHTWSVVYAQVGATYISTRNFFHQGH